MTHPLTEVREALAFYANKKTTTQEIYMEGGKAAIKALATLDSFIAGQDMPRVTYVQLTDKGLIRKWQDKPFEDGVLYVRADGQGWKPIETAPEEIVLVTSQTNEIFYAFKDYKGVWRAPDPCGGGTYILFDKPTHWLPLPEPPK